MKTIIAGGMVIFVWGCVVYWLIAFKFYLDIHNANNIHRSTD